MNKKIYLVLLVGLLLVGNVSAFGLGIDAEPRYNDEYGWFFYINFPYEEDVVAFLNLLGIADSIFINEEGHTVIDVNDLDYIMNMETRNQQIDQLTFLQWFNYINHAYRFVSPLDGIYMRGYNATGYVQPVVCHPYDLNGDRIYEMRCYPS